ASLSISATPIELIGDGVEHDQLGVGVLLAVEAEVAEGQKAQADGGLMSYGIDLPNLFRQSAVYADRILKGAPPPPTVQGSLPFTGPERKNDPRREPLGWMRHFARVSPRTSSLDGVPSFPLSSDSFWGACIRTEANDDRFSL